jgi:hypothetical protein
MAPFDPDRTDPGSSSRERQAEAGWLPWACGAGVGALQLAVVVVLPDGARSAGSFVMAVLTLAVVGTVVLAGPGRRR